MLFLAGPTLPLVTMNFNVFAEEQCNDMHCQGFQSQTLMKGSTLFGGEVLLN